VHASIVRVHGKWCEYGVNVMHGGKCKLYKNAGIEVEPIYETFWPVL